MLLEQVMKLHPCSEEESDKRINLIAHFNPLYESAMASEDKEYILKIAEQHQKAGLSFIAEKLYMRAGLPSESRRQYNELTGLVNQALSIIQQRECITPQEIAKILGLNKHQWYSVASKLRKTNKVEFIHRNFYVMKQERLL